MKRGICGVAGFVSVLAGLWVGEVTMQAGTGGEPRARESAWEKWKAFE